MSARPRGGTRPERLGAGSSEQELYRAQRTMLAIRLLVVPWALAVILTRGEPHYPPGYRTYALQLVVALGAGAVAVFAASTRASTLRSSWAAAAAGVAFDVAIASGFVWIHTFAQGDALWAVLFIPPLEGALFFALRGALATWAAVVVSYVLREAWGARTFGSEFLWNSIVFRMGIGLFIAATAGTMARSLVRDRVRLRSTLDDLSEAQRLASLGSWEWDVHADRVTWSDELRRIFDAEPETRPQYADYVQRVHPDDREKVEAAIAAALARAGSFELHHRILVAGSERVLHCNGRVVADASGRPLRIVGTAQDVTDSVEITEALRQSDARLRNILETATDAFIGTDANGIVREWNPRAEEMFGYSRSEAVGKPVGELTVPPALRSSHEAALTNIAAGAPSPLTGRRTQMTALNRRGQEFPVEVMLWASPDDGEVAFSAFVTDISVRKRSEDFLRLVHLVTLAANECTDTEAAYRRCLELVCSTVGWPVGHVYVKERGTDALRATDLWHMEPGFDFSALRSVNRDRLVRLGEGLAGGVFATGRPAWIEDVSVDLTSRRRQVSGDLGVRAAFGFPVSVGHEVVAVLEFFSPEAAKRDDELLDVMSGVGTQLGRAVERERAMEQLREAMEGMRAADRMKDTFLEAVSHDLRTPLAVVLGAARTLTTRRLPPDKTDDLIGAIARNAGRLERIILALLDLDRLRRGIVEPKRRPTRIDDLAVELVDDLELSSRVNVDTSPLVAWIDPAQVERILENLCRNAVRHTPSDASIWVRVAMVGEADLLLVVEDDGPGIPIEWRARIFEPFTRVDGANGSGGLGVGLSLVSRFAELHGGKVWVDERPGGGASFKVLLPDCASLDAPDSRQRRRDGGIPFEPAPIDIATAEGTAAPRLG